MRHQIFIHGPHHLRHRTPPQRAIVPPLRLWVCGSPVIIINVSISEASIIIRNKAKPDPLGERIRQQRGRTRLDEIVHLPGFVDDLPNGRPARFAGGAAEGGQFGEGEVVEEGADAVEDSGGVNASVNVRVEW